MKEAGHRPIKWGIMGTGTIAEQFAADLSHTSNGAAYAVGSRKPGNAALFAAQFGIPRAYGSYMELVNDPEIDVIYVATPHRYHLENALNSIRAGKAVLCEKPVTVNSRELELLISAARERRVFVMEAMWMRFLPPMQKAKEWVRAGRIGEVRLVQAEFGIMADWDPEGRLLSPELAGGALLDVGIYPLSFASMVFGAQPREIYSHARIGRTEVDEQFSALLTYDSGQVASLHGAIRLGMRNEAVIHGTKGCITLPSMNKAPSVSLYEGGKLVETYGDDRLGKGYEYEAEEVGRRLLAGQTESGIMPLDESLRVMEQLDTMRAQWGLRYPFE
ncbi:putative dehydrogenase [Fontibacillus phaseoli]|uniref:Putative dehydrogenase n=1 Tax=Fontibacillus phaseoli TaxID=1416533 RepID=A0A369BGX6_9BACL|nr:Gfo/Idh/MocA family oxidoreductase [Fontibacillus phaseoli]RCX20661.1 putative dehydrogenase [Fontibacillus phaseoli]